MTEESRWKPEEAEETDRRRKMYLLVVSGNGELIEEPNIVVDEDTSDQLNPKYFSLRT